MGLANVEAGTASVIAMIEPVVAAVLGMQVYHEKLDVWRIIGITLIIEGHRGLSHCDAAMFAGRAWKSGKHSKRRDDRRRCYMLHDAPFQALCFPKQDDCPGRTPFDYALSVKQLRR